MKWFYALGGFIFIVCLLMILWILTDYHRNHTAQNVRCSSFVRMDLAMDASHTILIDGVINIHRTTLGAILLFKGSTSTENKKTTLSRELLLSKKWEDDRNSFEYLVKQINVGPTDDTPDYIFNEWLSEMSVDNRHIFLDYEMQREDAIMVGGPYSILFMCVKY